MSIRRISVTAPRPPSVQNQKQAQERYHIRLIELHPQYRLLMSSLKEGIKATEIAAHFAENGWLHVNERTFAEAIRVYKNKCPHAIEQCQVEGLDSHVNPNQPQVDLRQQLQQLLRMQRVRLGRGLDLERSTGFLVEQVPKEIEQTVKIIRTIAEIDGLLKEGVGSSSKYGHEEHSVIENLNRVKRDQVTRDRLHAAVKQLAEVKI